MKKKFLKVVVLSSVLALLPISITPVLAANGDPIISPATENSTDITATVTDSYTIQIPTSYAFGDVTKTLTETYAYKEGTVTVTDKLLSDGNYLHVAFGTTTESDYKLISGTNEITYEIFNYDDTTQVRTPITHGSKVINVNNASTGDDLTATCHVGFDRATIPATGAYAGTLKFTASVDNQAT